MPQISDALFLLLNQGVQPPLLELQTVCLRSLRRLKGSEPAEWISLESRTPFQTYPRRRKRY
jgi:hypothetical protein